MDLILILLYLGVVVLADEKIKFSVTRSLIKFCASANTVLNVHHKPSEPILEKIIIFCMPSELNICMWSCALFNTSDRITWCCIEWHCTQNIFIQSSVSPNSAFIHMTVSQHILAYQNFFHQGIFRNIEKWHSKVWFFQLRLL